MNFDKDDPIYQFGEAADDFFMILRGRVKLFASNQFFFIQYGEGDCFGDSDSLLGDVRDSKATSVEESTIFSIKVSQIS